MIKDDELLKALEESGVKKVTREESNRILTGNDDLGIRFDEDEATGKQKNYIFVLGRELGLINKDEIKLEYDIESIGNLTFGEAKELINRMSDDLGLIKEGDPERIYRVTEKEMSLEWTVDSGVNFVGDSLAKCGHCKSFTGQNTSMNGTCDKGVKKGAYHGTERAPMLEGCFVFKHGERTKVLRASDYENKPFFEDDDEDVF